MMFRGKGHKCPTCGKARLEIQAWDYDNAAWAFCHQCKDTKVGAEVRAYWNEYWTQQRILIADLMAAGDMTPVAAITSGAREGG
jgi:uncharacterized OB-fold protein